MRAGADTERGEAVTMRVRVHQVQEFGCGPFRKTSASDLFRSRCESIPRFSKTSLCSGAASRNWSSIVFRSRIFISFAHRFGDRARRQQPQNKHPDYAETSALGKSTFFSL